MNDELPRTVGEIHECNAQRWPDRPAFVFGAQRLTHAQYLQRSRQVASALYGLGVRTQDRVAILAQNCMEYLEVYGACEISGFITATVNFRLAPPEFAFVINDGGAKVLVFEALYAGVIEQLKPQLTHVEHYVCLSGTGDPAAALPKPAWALDYHAWAAAGDVQGAPLRASGEDVAYLIYTSGTTGRPKGCMLGQREQVLCANALAPTQRSTLDSRILLMMPFFHIGAKAVQVAHTLAGGAVHVQRGFSVEAVLEEISREKINITHMAPMMTQPMLESPLLGRYDITSLNSLIYAAAPMPVTVLRKGLELLGDVFMQMYGQTEVIGTALLQHHHRPNGSERERAWLGSMGLPFEGVRIRIVDDAGDDCPVGTPGEIVVHSPSVARGYWNNPQATAETFRNGWCHTGDIGKLDEDGFLYMVDRKKDMIISGGENIYSREVEEAVMLHPAVSAAAVIGVPDAKWGEAVRAVVVLKPGAAATEAEIIEHTRAQIASYKKPRSVVFVSELPVLPSGKVNKVALRQQRVQR